MGGRDTFYGRGPTTRGHPNVINFNPMSCCAIPSADTSRFFSRLARLYRWRSRLFGLDSTQRRLIDGIRRTGLEGETLLEIGCGAGQLQRELLQAGARHGVGVDLSAGLLEEARREAQRAGLASRTDYRQGDFVALADAIAPAAIVVLDKVVCCYPDPERLLEAAMDRTRRVLALTYPRDRAATRAGVALMAALLRLTGCRFRPYVHDPASIEDWIKCRGFRRHSRARTFAWLTDIHIRGPEIRHDARSLRSTCEPPATEPLAARGQTEALRSRFVADHRLPFRCFVIWPAHWIP
jgi:SAM-dependent methyltransferase